jgi:hypothetical protein
LILNQIENWDTLACFTTKKCKLSCNQRIWCLQPMISLLQFLDVRKYRIEFPW